MIITTLPAELRPSIIQAYDMKLAEMSVKPLLHEFLAGKRVNDGSHAPTEVLAKKGLATKLSKFEQSVCNEPGIPLFDTFVFDLAYEKVSESYEGYKASMIEKGVEHVYNNAYYISIANEIRFFFEEFGEDSLYIEEDIITILDCALRDGFFDEIMVQAANCNDFDVTNLETTGEEIVKVCRALVTEKKQHLNQ